MSKRLQQLTLTMMSATTLGEIRNARNLIIAELAKKKRTYHDFASAATGEPVEAQPQQRKAVKKSINRFRKMKPPPVMHWSDSFTKEEKAAARQAVLGLRRAKQAASKEAMELQAKQELLKRQGRYLFSLRDRYGWRKNTPEESARRIKNPGLRNYNFVVQIMEGRWGSREEGFDLPSVAQMSWWTQLYADVEKECGPPPPPRSSHADEPDLFR